MKVVGKKKVKRVTDQRPSFEGKTGVDIKHEVVEGEKKETADGARRPGVFVATREIRAQDRRGE